MSDMLNFLASLPVGYMFCYSGCDVPDDYIEVNGQRLLKSEYPMLHQILLGNVIDDGTHFILPDSSKVRLLFDDTPNTKIIVKIR
jgi:hypothetical protein